MNILITGASEGLGLEIAKKFIREGHNVAICARRRVKLDEALTQLEQLAKDQILLWDTVDVSKETEIKEFIDDCIINFGKIDVLINNAGIYGPKGKIEDISSEEWKACIDINLFGTFYAMKHIIPHMKKNKYGKIINLSGGGATAPLPFISAYAASKCAVVRLTETIAEECKEFNIDINAIAPGLLDTRLLGEIKAVGPDVVGHKFYERVTEQQTTPLSLGADLCYYLASKESNGITGKLISANWDEWKTLHTKELTKDLYTLRRVV